MPKKNEPDPSAKSIYAVVSQQQFLEAVENFPAVRGGRVVRAVRWVFRRDGRSDRQANLQTGGTVTAPEGAQRAVSSAEQRERAEAARRRSITRGMDD